MAKLLKRKKPTAKHVRPVEDEPLENHNALPIDDTVTPIPDDVASAQHEAIELIEKLAKMTPNLMGTAHGIALIHSAQKWMAAHVEVHHEA